MKGSVLGVFLAAALMACGHAQMTEAPPANPEAAWAAWRAGDAVTARAMGEQLAARTETADEGRHIAALAAHVLGDYAMAEAHFNAVNTLYPRRRELRGPVFESLLHANRTADALAFARAHEMSVNAQSRAQSRLDYPIDLTMEGVLIAPFTHDALSLYLPGLNGRLNDRDAVFRLDTGGTFVALSPALATEFGVRSDNCAQGFANLQATQVCFGVADLELGGLRITNLPVSVVGALPSEQMGIPLGPVLGTNFLQLFLSTIDAPGQRLILSKRGDAAASAQHLALLPRARAETPFLLWGDHFILAGGASGLRRDLTFFVDSGLVAVADDGVQAGLLLPLAEAMAWAGASDAAAGTTITLPHAVSISDAEQQGQRAMVLPDAAWASFGTFGGIRVNGLISYGYLKHYSMTLDFDRRSLILSQ